jgi:hypothetical protein
MHTHLTYNSMQRLIVLLSLLRLHSSPYNNDLTPAGLNMLTLLQPGRSDEDLDLRSSQQAVTKSASIVRI